MRARALPIPVRSDVALLALPGVWVVSLVVEAIVSGHDDRAAAYARKYRGTDKPPDPLLAAEAQGWRERAECVDSLADFFPTRGWADPERSALAVCRRCAVTAECFAYVMACEAETPGVWGGTTHRYRKRLRRQGWPAT